MYLNLQDTATCNLVCKQLHQILNQDSVWRNLIWKNLFCKFFSFGQLPQDIKDFQKSYQTIYSNIRNGRYAFSRERITELYAVWTMQLLGHLVIVQIRQPNATNFKIWDFEKKERLQTLEPPSGEKFYSGVSSPCFAITNDYKRIICGCDSGKIMIYDLESMGFITTLTDPSIKREQPLGLCVAGEKLISTRCCETREISTSNGTRRDRDTAIDIWNLKTGKCQKTFIKKHFYPTCAPVIAGDKLILGVDMKDMRPLVFDLENGQDLTPLNEELDQMKVDSLAIVGDKLICAARSQLSIWDLESGKYLATFQERFERFDSNSLIAKGSQLIFSDTTNSINILNFDVSDEKLLQEITDAFREDFKYNMKKRIATDRFSRMPQETKNKIYGKLYEIIKHRLINDYWGCAEHAFHDQYGQSASNSEKAKAIENYLAAIRVSRSS
jgi:WD40 repeat protein